MALLKLAAEMGRLAELYLRQLKTKSISILELLSVARRREMDIAACIAWTLI